MDPITTWLINQGPAGIVGLALVFVFRAKEAQADKYQAQLQAINDQHRKDLEVMIERHNLRSEKWIEKMHALAEKLAGKRTRSKTIVGLGEEGDTT